MRKPIGLKSNTCTEGANVDAAGISGKVSAQYPGRSADLPQAMAIERWSDELAEVSRGRSRSFDRTEGPNMKYRIGASNFDGDRRRREDG